MFPWSTSRGFPLTMLHAPLVAVVQLTADPPARAAAKLENVLTVSSLSCIHVVVDKAIHMFV